MEDFTVIYDDEDVIGKVAEIKKCFLKHLGDLIADKETGMEEKTYQLKLIAELIEKLEDVSEQTIIKVSFNPMGTFNVYYIQGWEA